MKKAIAFAAAYLVAFACVLIWNNVGVEPSAAEGPEGLPYVHVLDGGLCHGKGISSDPLICAVTPDNTTVSGTGSAGSPLGMLPDFGGLFFCDGSDGALTFDGTTARLGITPGACLPTAASQCYILTRDVCCNGCTINSGVTIQARFRFMDFGTLTLNGKISRNGGNGTNGTTTNGPGGGNDGNGYFNGAGGGANGAGATTGGTGGAAQAPTGCDNSGGAAGTSAGPTAGGTGTTCKGGGGGAGGANNGGAGGTSTQATAGTADVSTSPVFLMIGMTSGGGNIIQGASGGGGGAGVAGHFGGGGGAGGGWMFVSAKRFTGSGSIESKGGNGGNGETGGNTGGGGGGGGGVIGVMYAFGSAPTVTVTGGTHGNGNGTGTNGGDGGNGLARIFHVGN